MRICRLLSDTHNIPKQASHCTFNQYEAGFKLHMQVFKHLLGSLLTHLLMSGLGKIYLCEGAKRKLPKQASSCLRCVYTTSKLLV